MTPRIFNPTKSGKDTQALQKYKGNHVSLLKNKNQEILKYLSHISVDEFLAK